MIRMSQRRFRLLLATLAIASLSGLACSRTCTLIGCLEGLSVVLTGGFDPDKTYTIDMGHVMPTGEVVPVMTCLRTRPTGPNECTSPTGVQTDPQQMRIFDNSIRKLRVKISLDGMLVGQKDYDVDLRPREINGEGCGWCESDSVNVEFPVRPVWGAQGRDITSGWCTNDDLTGFGFEATSDELSADQRGLLSAMQEVPSGPQACPPNQRGCSVQISYYDGFLENWYTWPGDPACVIDPNHPDRLISFASFEPFSQALGCVHSKTLAPGETPRLAPNPFCHHGIPVTAGATTNVSLDVPVDAMSALDRPRRIRLNTCNLAVGGGLIQLQLFDPAGTTLLAQGSVSNDLGGKPCHLINFTFPAAGTYVLKIVVSADYLGRAAYIAYE